MKSNPQGAVLKQQASCELNKRRTLLQDNSWIKKRPEEEKDDNYGKAALNRHNSHDALHRKINGKDEPKAVLSRYRSDDTLDRISERNDAAKTSKAKTLDSQQTNRSISTFRSSDASKSHPGSLLHASTSQATVFSPAASPVKKKRQSWFPPPPPGYSTTPSTEASRRNPAAHPPIPPKPSSPIPSPKLLRQKNREISPSKLGMSTETKRFTEGNKRTQDLDMVKVTASPQETDKGKELDNIIKMNKSLNRNQGLDGLFRTNRKVEQTDKRAKSLESLIFMNTQMDKDGKGNKSLGDFSKVNQRTDKSEKGSGDLESIMKVAIRTDKTRSRKQDFDGLSKVNPETNKIIKSSQSLGNLIEVSPEGNTGTQGGQNLDCLIKVVPAVNQGNQDLDNVIKVNSSTNKSSEQGLDELISINPKAVKNTAGDQDFDKQTKVMAKILTNNQRNQDLDNLIKVNPSITGSDQSSDLGNLTQLKPSALRNVNSSSIATGHERSKNTVTYTRTYVENSEIPKNGYQENSSGKYIQTVYSTSDRSVIERDMCTYCRKPLGMETKMILDELQICCHSTCFKCEICKQPLENLKAGDSIWIYRQTIHCEPCYSKVMAKWIQ